MGKKGVRNGIMFARWPFYPLTMIPPVSSKLCGRGVQPTADETKKGGGGGGDARSVSYLTKNLTDSSVILHYFHVREKYRLRGITLTSTHSRVFV